MTRVGAAPDAIARLDRRLAALELGIASAALAVALFVSLYAILMRALRLATGEWVLDLPIELLLVIAVFGSGALLSRRAHIHVEVFAARFGRRLRQVVTAIVQALVLLTCGFLTSRGVIAAGQVSAAGLRRRELFDTPESLLVWISVAGLALWTLHAAIALVETLTGGSDRLPPPSDAAAD